MATSKTERFAKEGRRIMLQDKPLPELYEEYAAFCKTQKFLSAKPGKLMKRYKAWYFVVREIAETHGDDFEEKAWEFRDAWNMIYKLPWIHDYELIPILCYESKNKKRNWSDWK